MKKLVLQLSATALLFLGLGFLLSRVPWTTVFKVEQLTNSTEEKLGDLFWDIYNKTEKEINSEKVRLPMDSILSNICKANKIDKSQIKLHVIESDEVNAFAMPNKHLVVYTGLILACENEAELYGVMCHEIAHMELSHVMKKYLVLNSP